MKRVVLIILLFIAGMGVIAYPSVSDYLAQKNSSYAIDSYKAAVIEQDAEYIEKERHRASEYNRNIKGFTVSDPYVDGFGYVMQKDYYETLNLGGIMGYIEIPKITVRLPIYHGTGEETLKKGIGHMEGSSLPVGGDGSHAILTGHTGLKSAKILTDLTAMEVDDIFYLYVLDEILAYKIDNISVVEPYDISQLSQVPEKDYCTLITCTPYIINSHRLLVRGERIPYTPADTGEVIIKRPESSADKLIRRAAITTASVMGFAVAVVIIGRHFSIRANNPKYKKTVRRNRRG